MDQLDELRLKHSHEMLAKGRSELESEPDLGFYHICSSRLLLISTQLKNNGALPVGEIYDFIRELNEIISTYEIDLHLEKQNELLILALAAGDAGGAIRMASVSCREDSSHKFDRLLNRKLRSVLLQTRSTDDLNYNSTKSEKPMFDDLDSIASSRSTDLQGTDKYWRATKSRRYANTIFAYDNLFRRAFEVLQGI